MEDSGLTKRFNKILILLSKILTPLKMCIRDRGDTGGEARYRGDLGGGLDDHESVGLYGLGFP